MKLREIIILTLGALGFCSQIIAQFTDHDVNYIVMGGALALLGVAPLLRLDERNHKPQKEEP